MIIRAHVIITVEVGNENPSDDLEVILSQVANDFEYEVGSLEDVTEKLAPTKQGYVKMFTREEVNCKFYTIHNEQIKVLYVRDLTGVVRLEVPFSEVPTDLNLQDARATRNWLLAEHHDTLVSLDLA